MYRVSIILVILVGSNPTKAQQLEDAIRIFDEANRLIQSGAYEEAIDQYHAVLETGHVSSAVYHNLASAYFRIDEFGEAVQYYQRAQRLDGDDLQIIHNIQITETVIQSPFSKLPSPFWRLWWDGLSRRYSALPFLCAGLGLYLISVLLFSQSIWFNLQSQWHRRARLASLSTGLFLLFTAIMISAERTSVQGAAVLEPTTLTTDTESIEVPEGIVVTIIDETKEDIQIQLPNGIQGYVDASVLGDF